MIGAFLISKNDQFFATYYMKKPRWVLPPLLMLQRL